MVRVVALLSISMLLGCSSSHVSGDDAGADAGSPMCVPPAIRHCCCEGDVVVDPQCADGAWTCPSRYSYYRGSDCDWLGGCGGPCNLPCPPDAGVEDEVRCTGDPVVFPSFDRSCASDADCTIAVHQTDCCGNTAATGIHVSERVRFDRAEDQCRAQYPLCGCPSGPAVADDGTSGFGEPRVSCQAGTCTSTFVEG